MRNWQVRYKGEKGDAHVMVEASSVFEALVIAMYRFKLVSANVYGVEEVR